MKISHLINRIRFALSLIPEHSLLPQVQIAGHTHVKQDDSVADLGLSENSRVQFSYQMP
jgi:hypothetical protein